MLGIAATRRHQSWITPGFRRPLKATSCPSNPGEASMKHCHTYCAIALLAASSIANSTTLGSDFGSDIDQWKTRDFFTGSLGPTPNWTLQAIESGDSSDFAVFSAPGPKFTGDKGNFYGGTFSFDLVTNHRSANTAANFTLAIGSGAPTLAGATVLYWYGGQPSTTEYTNFVATLNVSDTHWKLGGGPSGGGVAPSEAQFRNILSSISFVYIPVEWNDGPDSSRLDNVYFNTSAVPEPSSIALLLSGVGLLVLRRKIFGNALSRKCTDA